jgi:hypothetical protein
VAITFVVILKNSFPLAAYGRRFRFRRARYRAAAATAVFSYFPLLKIIICINFNLYMNYNRKAKEYQPFYILLMFCDVLENTGDGTEAALALCFVSRFLLLIFAIGSFAVGGRAGCGLRPHGGREDGTGMALMLCPISRRLADGRERGTPW